MMKEGRMDVLTIDGSFGEGGGQILRTALSLSTLTARAFRLVNIRARRRNPGLLPQHLSAVRAAAAISGAAVSGDQLGSVELNFAPSHLPRSGSYVFDVAQTAERGSAGSVTLILQTLLVPLALADGASSLVLRGGTHVEWSPPFDDLASSYFPILRRMGFGIEAELKRWGWYPVGQGEVVCSIATAPAEAGVVGIKPVELLSHGPLRRIAGRAVAANLPAHIPQRMVDRAQASLGELGVPVDIEAQLVTLHAPAPAYSWWPNTRNWRRASPPMAGWESPPKRLPMKRSLPSANIMPPMPPLSFTSPISCCCRWRLRPALPPSRRPGRAAIS
jgi:RNA 3'-terminal phosphate cyclase (ATP)